MRKILTSLFLLLPMLSMADEGMWLPSLISQRIGDMQAKGFKLSAEDIYSINQASLKDAVMLFGRGCTGEIISSKGLVLTNHHCGYGSIQKHSSIEHDYLKDGFWAMEMKNELPNEGLTVSFLDRMEDVTEKVLAGYVLSMTEGERDSIIRANSSLLIAQAKAGNPFIHAQVESLFYGNQYFLYVFRVFKDVRLVGAPPSSVGKFGGDTDNWMWPRHTGDFSLFRIYADKDNNPAEYSPDNVPYLPKRYFKVSVDGVKEGDFTFVYGFPGSTREYITSDAVKYIALRSNPAKIALRTLILDAQKRHMSQSQAVRIMYSSKNANVSNAWKKWQGEMKGIIKMNTIGKKVEFENRFRQWAVGSGYEGLTDSLSRLYAQLDQYAFAQDYYNESVNAIELPQFASRLMAALENKTDFSDVGDLKKMVESFYKDYYLPIDKECFISLVTEFAANVPDKFKPSHFFQMMEKYGTVEDWAEDFFNSSVFASREKLLAYDGHWENAADSLSDDPAVIFARSFSDKLSAEILPVTAKVNSEITLLYRDYMRGQMEFEKDKAFYPDANLTLRVAYGKVEGYRPADAVWYRPSSTLEGIMQKDNPEIFDYDVPQKLRDIYAAKDYGQWAVDGTVPVCFLATNHTTGGNSGSPIINAEGHLVGINFDRVWEGTMSDVVYDPEVCRNISLDIRYVLFVIDRLAGADRLLEEIEVAQN